LTGAVMEWGFPSRITSLFVLVSATTRPHMIPIRRKLDEKEDCPHAAETPCIRRTFCNQYPCVHIAKNEEKKGNED